MSRWERQTAESYDRVAEPYSQATRPAPEENLQMAGAYSILAATARSVAGEGAAVVDVGCGPGWWVRHFVGHGVEARGVDISPGMVALARANVPHAAFQVGSVLDIPLPSQSMAGVACMYVLHHVPDQCVDQAIGELSRVLTHDGLLLLGGHIGDDHAIKTTGYGGHPMNVEVNRRPYAFWEEQVSAAGLTIEAHTIYAPATPAPSHALFARKPAPPASPLPEPSQGDEP